MEAGSKRRVNCKNVAHVEHTEIDDCLAGVDNANRIIKGDSSETEFGKSEGRTGGKKKNSSIYSIHVSFEGLSKHTDLPSKQDKYRKLLLIYLNVFEHLLCV